MPLGVVCGEPHSSAHTLKSPPTTTLLRPRILQLVVHDAVERIKAEAWFQVAAIDPDPAYLYTDKSAIT